MSKTSELARMKARLARKGRMEKEGKIMAVRTYLDLGEKVTDLVSTDEPYPEDEEDSKSLKGQVSVEIEEEPAENLSPCEAEPYRSDEDDDEMEEELFPGKIEIVPSEDYPVDDVADDSSDAGDEALRKVSIKASFDKFKESVMEEVNNKLSSLEERVTKKVLELLNSSLTDTNNRVEKLENRVAALEKSGVATSGSGSGSSSGSSSSGKKTGAKASGLKVLRVFYVVDSNVDIDVDKINGIEDLRKLAKEVHYLIQK